MEHTLLPLIAPVMRWPSSEARAWVTHAFPQICRQPNVLALVLFGSAIRPTDSSFDFDCLYVFDGDRPEISPPPLEVDIRGYDAAQVDRLIANGHDLLGWSLRLGALVCEREAFWSRLQEQWRDRLPFPSPNVADERAEQAERLLADLHESGDRDAAIEQCVTAITHRARAALLRANIFPASRPELPGQLRQIGASQLADALAAAIAKRNTMAHGNVQAVPRHATGAA